MSSRLNSTADTDDLFNRANAARINEARRRVRLARASRGGVKTALRNLEITMREVLREEIGRKE